MKKILRIILNYLKQTDKWLWLFCLGLSCFSLVLLAGIAYSGMGESGYGKVATQGLALGLGVVMAIILSRFDYRNLTKLWKLHVPAAYMIVLATFFIGTGTKERISDKSWLVLPGGLSLQPSELLKISFILAFAYHIHMVHNELNRPHNVLLLCLHGAIPVLLIHVQGDDGSALIFAMIFIAMIFAAGLSWKYIIPALTAGILSVPFIWFYFLNDFQRQRFMALFDPRSNPQGIMYQQYNAKLAIGSGQIWGKGIFTTNHKYVPASSTDFIFSFIGESLGFVGCVAVVAAFIAICVKMVADAHKADDIQGRMICVGVLAMIASQAIINIGMCISVLPVIGITLPFLSSGGSSLVSTYLGVGIVLSVYMHTSKPLFSE